MESMAIKFDDIRFVLLIISNIEIRITGKELSYDIKLCNKIFISGLIRKKFNIQL